MMQIVTPDLISHSLQIVAQPLACERLQYEISTWEFLFSNCMNRFPVMIVELCKKVEFVSEIPIFPNLLKYRSYSVPQRN
jgi:hypothetical protein